MKFMVSNRVKRNFWCVLLLLGMTTVVGRGIDVATGGEWWPLLSAIVITAVPGKAYMAYRKAVKDGNMFGPVNIFDRQ